MRSLSRCGFSLSPNFLILQTSSAHILSRSLSQFISKKGDFLTSKSSLGKSIAMATVAIQQPTPPRSPMIRKRTFSSSSDGMHYGPRVSKQPKTAARQQFSPQRKRKQPAPEEKKKNLDSAFVDGAKVDLACSFVPPTASKRDKHSAAKESQAGLEKKCVERQAMVSIPVGGDMEYASDTRSGGDRVRRVGGKDLYAAAWVR